MSAQIISAANGTAMDLRPFLNFPAGIPPPGVKANYINPTRHSLGVMIPSSVFVAIMMLFLAGRTWCLLRIRHAIGLEDVFCYIGALGTIATYVSLMYTNTVGYFGYEQYDLKVGQLIGNIDLQGLLAFTVGSTIALIFVKLSFFIMFWKLFNQLRWMRLSLWSLGLLFTLFNIATGLILIIAVVPRPGETWLAHMTTPIELIPVALAVPVSSVALASDVFILVLPIVAVQGLRMQRQRKLAVMVVFMAGVLACAASAAGLYFRPKIYSTTNASMDLAYVFLCSVLEYSIGVTCACTPAISQLLHASPSLRPIAEGLSSFFFCCCCLGRRGRSPKESSASTAAATDTTGTERTIDDVQPRGPPQALMSRWDWWLPRSLRGMTFSETAPGPSAEASTNLSSKSNVIDGVWSVGTGASTLVSATTQTTQSSAPARGTMASAVLSPGVTIASVALPEEDSSSMRFDSASAAEAGHPR